MRWHHRGLLRRSCVVMFVVVMCVGMFFFFIFHWGPDILPRIIKPDKFDHLWMFADILLVPAGNAVFFSFLSSVAKINK